VYVPVGFVKGEATFNGKPTDYWVHALNQEGFLGNSPPPGDAGKTLREGGAAAVPVLCEMAESPDDNLRQQALNALALMGAEAKAAKPVLEATLKTERNRTRFFLAGQALGHVDPVAAAEVLSAILQDKDSDMMRKACAFAALLKIAPQGQEAVPALQEILNDPKQDLVLRVQAIDVLWHMKQPAEPLVLSLCEMVKADNSPVGVQALEVLQGMGPAAKSAVPTLMKVLERHNLPLAGKRYGPPHRFAVIQTLGDIGPDAAPAVPALIASLQSNNYFIRREVAMALARMGPAGKQAVAARDAVWGASITLLATRSPDMIALPALVETEKRTWIPGKEQTLEDVSMAIRRIDPSAASRARVLDFPED
jgi:HEAT repeat protein